MKNSVAIIIPYFGPLPNYFPLWLNSVKYNQDIDVIFLTNNAKPDDTPKNCLWKRTTFERVKARAQSLVDFTITLSEPYKLADYKPCYGKMFADYLSTYDWWGFGDIDTIYGDLSLIINDQKLNEYDKIFALGHLTLLRNTEKNNNLYRIKLRHQWNYKDVFRSGWVYHFDEGGGLSFIAQKKGCYTYIEKPNEMSFADILPEYSDFRLAYSNKQNSYVFTWKNGLLREWWLEDNKVHTRECPYVHLQKRKMSINNNHLTNGFVIIPNKFIPLYNIKINAEFIKRASISAPKVMINGSSNSLLGKLRQYGSIRKLMSKLRYKVAQKVRKIPINGNEVFFGTEKPLY